MPSPRGQSLQRDEDEQISTPAIENLPMKRKAMPTKIVSKHARKLI